MITEQQAHGIMTKHIDDFRNNGTAAFFALPIELLAAFREVERITAEACAAKLDHLAAACDRGRYKHEDQRNIEIGVLENAACEIREILKGDQHA